MKIRGGSPFHHPALQQAQKSQKTKKAKKSKKKSSLKGVKEADAVDAVESIAPTEEVDSPYFDAMEEASTKMEQDGTDMEEATRAVVSAVIEEHFGKKNLAKKDLEDITKSVSASIVGDRTLHKRLETVLQKMSRKKK